MCLVVPSTLLLAVQVFSSYAQTNAALTATSTHSGGGVAPNRGPNLYNDNLIAPYLSINNMDWGWISTNGWIEYTWNAPQRIDSITFHNGSDRPARHFTTLILEYWDGTSYVFVDTVRRGNTTDITGYKLPAAITTTKLRFNRQTGSNPAYREIQVWSLPSIPNDAGITKIVSPHVDICDGSYAVSVNVKNYGTNTINSLQVNWSIDNVLQPALIVTTPLVASGNPGINDLDVMLGNTFIANSTSLKVWTSLPNNAVDSVANNDTISFTYIPKDFKIDLPSDTVCTGSDVEFRINPLPPATASNWEWYSGLTTYNLIAGANTNSYTLNNASANNNYYSQFLLNGVLCSTDTINIHTINPLVISVEDSSRCDAGTLILNATGSPGAVIRWYDDPLSTTPLFTGNDFTTPFLNQSATFWAAAEVGGVSRTDSLMYPLASASTTGSGHIMFTMETDNDIIIRALSVKVSTAVNNNIAFDVYYRPDNYNTIAGANTSNVGWILLSSRANLVSMGNSAYSLIADNLSLAIPNGSTYSFYVVPVTGTHQYSSLANNTIASANADMTIRGGHRGSALFAAGTTGGIPAFKFAYDLDGGCQSVKMPVNAFISGADLNVDFGADVNSCIDSGDFYFLNAMNPGLDYLWDNNYNGQVRPIDQSGTYWVQVKDANGCIVSDTINIKLRPNPIISLGDEVFGCADAIIQLDSKDNGIQRYWNTGQTTRQINVDRSGVYSVLVTGDNGCVKTDSVTVSLNGFLPLTNNIRVRNRGALTFDFEQVNPVNTQNYYWDFGDGNFSNSANPTHTYAVSGNFVVTLNAASLCGSITDTATVHIMSTSINAPSINGAKVTVYPNPTKDIVTISIDGNIKIETIQVLDIQGRIVKVIEGGQVNTALINVSNMTNGLYFLQINTAQGNAQAKFEVMK